VAEGFFFFFPVRPHPSLVWSISTPQRYTQCLGSLLMTAYGQLRMRISKIEKVKNYRLKVVRSYAGLSYVQLLCFCRGATLVAMPAASWQHNIGCIKYPDRGPRAPRATNL
jgi:hypothetical protein